MIKGWRLNPAWVSHYEQQRDGKRMTALLATAAQAQAQTAEIQKRNYEEAQRHRAECHADKVANGEVKVIN